MSVDLTRLKTKASPSSLKRVEKCPASAFISLLVDEKETSHSVEGKTAHAVAQVLGLNYEEHLKGIVYGRQDRLRMAETLVRKATDSQIQDNRELITEKMIEHCLGYIESCYEKKDMTRILFLEPDMWHSPVSSVLRVFEQELDYTTLCNSNIPRKAIVDFAQITNYEDGFTSVEVVDFKYGFAKVSAYDNLQLMAYLILVYDNFKEEIKGSKVHFSVGIYQPRSEEKLDSHYLSIDELEEYRKRIMNITKEAHNIESPAVPSADNCKYCAGVSVCSAPVKELENGLEELATYLNENNATFEMSEEKMVSIYKTLALCKQYDKIFRDILKDKNSKGELPDSFLTTTRNMKHVINQDKLAGFLDERLSASDLIPHISAKSMADILGAEFNKEAIDEFIELRPSEPIFKLRKGL